MRIVFFIYSMQSGGAERVTATLANVFAQEGHSVTVLTLAPVTTDFYGLLPEVKRIGLGLVGRSNGVLNAVRANFMRIRTLRSQLREIGPDVVVSMMTTAAVLGVVATRGLNCRVIVSERVHPPMFPLGLVWEWLRRRAYPLADTVVMQTAEGLQWLDDNIPRANGAVIPNPIQYPLPIRNPILQPAAFVKADRRLILAVGRLDKQKGFDILIQAFVSIAASNPTWDLVILGEGELRSVFHEQIMKLGMTQRIALLGRAGNIGDWYERADLYVMSSRFEGFPNTLAEALSYGCAAISYDCETGPRDLITDGVNGLLLDGVGNVHVLATAMERLMANDALRISLGDQATQVRFKYALGKVVDKWMAVFGISKTGKR